MSWRNTLGVAALSIALFTSGVGVAQTGTQSATSGASERERTQYIDQTVGDIGTYIADVLTLIQDAETEGDALLLDCLNPKLAGLQALSLVVVTADGVYDEALARDNYDLADAEYSKVMMAKGQADTLRTNADACVPAAGTSFSGQGRWSSTRPEDQEDDSKYESDPSGYTRPPEASPFT